MRGGLLSGAERLRLSDGRELRLLSALEVMQARREAEELAAREDRERALCSNACLLARALERRGRPVFASGRDVLAGLTVEEIGALARRWSEFNREENPGLSGGEERTEALKKVWSTRRRSACGGACSGLWGRSRPRRGPGG